MSGSQLVSAGGRRQRTGQGPVSSVPAIFVALAPGEERVFTFAPPRGYDLLRVDFPSGLLLTFLTFGTWDLLGNGLRWSGQSGRIIGNQTYGNIGRGVFQISASPTAESGSLVSVGLANPTAAPIGGMLALTERVGSYGWGAYRHRPRIEFVILPHPHPHPGNGGNGNGNGGNGNGGVPPNGNGGM